MKVHSVTEKLIWMQWLIFDCVNVIMQVRYKQKDDQVSLYSLLPETADTRFARHMSDLQSEVTLFSLHLTSHAFLHGPPVSLQWDSDDNRSIYTLLMVQRRAEYEHMENHYKVLVDDDFTFQL